MITAVLDACVLYSAPLRDLWMHLTVHMAFQPKWTDLIQDEWIRNVLLNRPDLKPQQLARTRTCMERWGRDRQVPPFESLLPELTLPDLDDRHVLAAAIAARAPLIVTFNLNHFPDALLAAHGVRAVHPDAFASDLLEADEGPFLAAVRAHRRSLIRPPKDAEEYLDTLARSGLVLTAGRLRTHSAAL